MRNLCNKYLSQKLIFGGLIFLNVFPCIATENDILTDVENSTSFPQISEYPFNYNNQASAPYLLNRENLQNNPSLTLEELQKKLELYRQTAIEEFENNLTYKAYFIQKKFQNDLKNYAILKEKALEQEINLKRQEALDALNKEIALKRQQAENILNREIELKRKENLFNTTCKIL